MSELSTLDLSFNRINVIHELPLTLNLKAIYLQNNKISAIDNNAFVSVRKLKYLNLANNNLRELSPLSVPWDTAQMSLRGNPWRCDCHMRWLKLPNKEIDMQAINVSMICVYPSRLRGMDIRQLSAPDLSCPTSYAGPVVAVLLSTFIVLVSLVVAYALYRKRKSMPCRKSMDQSGNYVAVYTHDDIDDTHTKVSIDEVKLVGGKEIYA
ncbi:hypothetical protein FSP39_012865 [Pinctada imbricata]|uniref:LRRCT domain-containing protein n=1 Tax=Pinctada imbricata TaxID=66713 RepID=A0AA88YKG0_PINIB|nr:hypothetical protein FSP39_012865 [Pinctada imbricata]